MDSDGDPCPVCHEAMMIYAIGICDHPICYRCSIRMRDLCDQMYCPICRTDLPRVYMVKHMMKESEIPRYGYQQNRKLKIFFEDSKIRQKAEKLLEHKCPKCRNQQSFKVFKELQTHMRKEHSLFYCDLCVDHLKIFTSERKFYDRTDLATHRRLGDKNDSSYKGHPLCRFCDVRFLDNDELFRHLRKDHYYCHFCETDGSHDFYSDYDDLKMHFKDNHYLCEEGECQSAQFTHAFRTDIDFKAHVTTDHNRILSKAQARQTRTIDVDFHLAPRRQGRIERGIITMEDYEESRSSSGARGRGSRYGNRTSHKDRFRDADMEKAIQASLSVMKDDSAKKTDSKKNSDEESEKEPKKLVHDEANFPTLGAPPATFKRPLTPTNPENKDSDSEESLAKRLAKANSMSVQHGRLGLADFPSLGVPTSNLSNVKTTAPSASSNVAKYSRPETQITSTASDTSSKVQPSRINSNKRIHNHQRGRLMDEDFPELPTSTKNINKTTGTWVKTQPPIQQHNTQSNSNMQNINIVKSLPMETKSVVPKSHKKPSEKVLNDVNEFPSLGESSGDNLNFFLGRRADDKKSKNTSKIDWFDIDKNEFSVENIKGDKDNVDLFIDSKKVKKKKKKKPKEQGDHSSQKNAAVDKESCTLDNIACSLLSVTTSETEEKDMKQEIPHSQASGKSDSKINDKESQNWTPPKYVDKKSSKQAVASPSAESKDQKSNKQSKNMIQPPTKSEDQKSNKQSKNMIKPTTKSEDQNAGKQSQVKCKDSVTSKLATNVISKENRAAVAEEGFSQLNTQSKAPPGFNKLAVPTSPPGFSDAGHGSRPPPGFKAAAAPHGQDTQKLLDEAIKDISLNSLMPMSTITRNFDYQKPENFQSRNRQLISDIQYHLGDQDSFEKFRSLSGSFRSGQILASEYYMECEILLGKDNFRAIFQELLVLLPEIHKQLELLAVYNDVQGLIDKESKGKGANGKKGAWISNSPEFITCNTCQQVLVQKDLDKHISSHDTDLDFPSLHSSSFTSGHGLGDWVKAT